MGYSYLTEESEYTWSPSEHDHDEEEESALQKALAALRLEAETSAKAAMKLAAAMEREICSCGYYTCGMIGTFGLPQVTYDEHIEPLECRKRDPRALELRAERGSY